MSNCMKIYTSALKKQKTDCEQDYKSCLIDGRSLEKQIKNHFVSFTFRFLRISDILF